MASVAVKFFGTESAIDLNFIDEEDSVEPELDITTLKRSLRISLSKGGYTSKKRLNHEVLSATEMDCLAYHAQRDCPESQELLIIFCGRLIDSQVKKAISPTKGDSAWDYHDLFNAGCIGVLTAFKTWKPSRGHFTSWATYSIIGRISQEKRSLYSPIFIKNEHLWRLSLSLPFLTLKYETEIGRPASLEDLADWLNKNNNSNYKVTADDLSTISAITSPVSLDSEVTGDYSDDSESTLLDITEDPKAEQPDERILKQENIDSLYSLVDKLDEDQSLIVKLYHGLDEETRSLPGSITFTDVVSILRKRKPNKKWSVKSCEESNRKAIQKLKQIISSEDIDIRF